MTFYVKAPSGEIPLHRLKEAALFRLSFLQRLSSFRSHSSIGVDQLFDEFMRLKQWDCLIEGNATDRIAHYILRFVSVRNDDFRLFVVDAESRLFRVRLSHMRNRDKLRLLRELKRHLTIDELKEEGHRRTSVKVVAVDIATRLRFADLTDASVKVPFELVLPLVSARKVFLSRGTATISSFEQFDVLFECLFRELLSNGIKELSWSRCVRLCDEDKRLDELCNLITTGKTIALSREDLEERSLRFPPCMRLLYDELRRNHRLGHFSRVQLTLFLKEIGMPIEEALLFWQSEYDRPPSVASRSVTCARSWSKEARRYTYNIRHLYGLEGSMNNYTTSSCSTLQSDTFGARESVGCPFRNDDAFRAVFLRWGLKPNEFDSLMSLAENGRYSDACCGYYDLAARGSSRFIDSQTEAASLSTSFRKCPISKSDQEVKLIDSGTDGDHFGGPDSRPAHFYLSISELFSYMSKSK